jgi:acyl-CoA reductase-like NAD-dependent aldehyde dehydrogenase
LGAPIFPCDIGVLLSIVDACVNTSFRKGRVDDRLSAGARDEANMSKQYTRIRSAAIDGRAHSNIIFAITQLKKLHQLLVREAQVIEETLKRDTGCSTMEAKLEYYLALKELRDHYVALDKKKALEMEYAVAKGKDAPGRRDAVGVVIVDPSAHTPLYSVVSALSAAIAAGNCVILQASLMRNGADRTWLTGDSWKTQCARLLRY